MARNEPLKTKRLDSYVKDRTWARIAREQHLGERERSLWSVLACMPGIDTRMGWRGSLAQLSAAYQTITGSVIWNRDLPVSVDVLKNKGFLKTWKDGLFTRFQLIISEKPTMPLAIVTEVSTLPPAHGPSTRPTTGPAPDPPPGAPPDLTTGSAPDLPRAQHPTLTTGPAPDLTPRVSRPTSENPYRKEIDELYQRLAGHPASPPTPDQQPVPTPRLLARAVNQLKNQEEPLVGELLPGLNALSTNVETTIGARPSGVAPSSIAISGEENDRDKAAPLDAAGLAPSSRHLLQCQARIMETNPGLAADEVRRRAEELAAQDLIDVFSEKGPGNG